LNLVESFDVINPFYKIIGANLKELIDEKLRYFKLENEEGNALVIMPFLLRKTPDVGLEETYYDVISPYGYSGPLFNYNLSRAYLIAFWEQVDNWYKKNNVVSEFVRFSLNNNQQFYSGILIPTLANVNGKIIDKEDQWNNFKQKVRNNYRKSTEHGLRSVFLDKKTITKDDIKTYHNIYTTTMERIGADAQYFYSLSYFEKVIKLSDSNFRIVLIYKDDVAISAELILIAGDTLYSYLGGTLSDYFNYRPNDFLKIEVMDWARENNYKYYLLGGGRTDNDSLYQYKKTFFPNDPDAIYYTGRKIVNKSVYKTLNKIMNSDVVINGHETNTELAFNKTNYFPAYRVKQRN